MKLHSLTVACLLVAAPLCAQTSFPGLKEILTAAEWERAGLSRLTPDEIGVIDAALIRHHASLGAQPPVAVANAAPAGVATLSAPTAPPANRGVLERFGLPTFDDSGWRNVPPMRAKVVKWESGNRFRLDNGQVWEGFEAIPYELVGKNVEIQARPHQQYALIVEGQNTTLRVMRLR